MVTDVPIGRLAPSPTGSLHLGHARSFLLAWWSIRAQGGQVLLRMEDLDSGRARPELADQAMRDLEWLGLDWDGEPRFQTSDTTPYGRALERLLDSGQAYPCTCSRRAVLDALDAPHAGGEVRYPGTCRGRWTSVRAAVETSGGAAGVRFRVPEGPIRWHDDVLGSQVHDPSAEVGDFLIARRDGAWAYQLAVVVDDARDGVTEVLRGDDLAPSAARQRLLQEALGLPRPRWLHVPLVVDEQGRRLAKRDADLALATLREARVDPRALVAWVARSAGWEVPARSTAGEVVAAFDLETLPRRPVVVDADVRADLMASTR